MRTFRVVHKFDDRGREVWHHQEFVFGQWDKKKFAAYGTKEAAMGFSKVLEENNDLDYKIKTYRKVN